jgi:hypothetical protein
MLTPGGKSRPACAHKAAMPLPASVGFRVTDTKSVVANEIRKAFTEIEWNEPGMSMITKDRRRHCHCQPRFACGSEARSLPSRTKPRRRSLKLRERTGNVYDNKGPQAALPLPASVGFRVTDIKSAVANETKKAFTKTEGTNRECL